MVAKQGDKQLPVLAALRGRYSSNVSRAYFKLVSGFEKSIFATGRLPNNFNLSFFQRCLIIFLSLGGIV